MIRIIETLSWLNQFEATHLRGPSKAQLRFITDIHTEENKRKKMITSAINHSRNNVDRMELPELLLHIAEFRFRQQQYSLAHDFANGAVQIYPDGSHAQAIARWILGIIAWKLPRPKLAYSSWYYARDIFENLAEQAFNNKQSAKEKWYQESLVKINVDLICTPEETYTWLDYFEPSHLSRAAQQINETILEKITGNQFQDVYKLIGDLQTLGKHSSDYIENAEILVECALAISRLGNLNEATHMLQKAIDQFKPESHHQAVSRWLLGILQWEHPEKNSQAIMNWEKSLENFDALAHKFDLDNNPTRRDWYRGKREIMAQALTDKIAEKLGP